MGSDLKSSTGFCCNSPVQGVV